jgi:hypothetical protein
MLGSGQERRVAEIFATVVDLFVGGFEVLVLLQLLLLRWRYALVDGLCGFIACQSRSLQAHQRVLPQGNLLGLSLELGVCDNFIPPRGGYS